MKKFIKSFLVALVLVPCAALFAACDDSNDDKINADDNTGAATANPFDGIKSGNVYAIKVIENGALQTFTSYDLVTFSQDKSTWEEIDYEEYRTLTSSDYKYPYVSQRLNDDNTQSTNWARVGAVIGHMTNTLDEGIKYYRIPVISVTRQYQKIEIGADGTLTAKTYGTKYTNYYPNEPYEPDTERTYKVSGVNGEVLRVYDNDGKLVGFSTGFIDISFFVE